MLKLLIDLGERKEPELSVLILTPFKLELDLLFPNKNPIESSTDSVPVYKISDGLFASFTGQGKAQCAAHTSYLLSQTHYSAVVLIGSAGVLQGSLNQDSAYLVESIYEWDFNSSIGSKQNRVPTHKYSSINKPYIQDFLSTNSNISVVTIASGDSDVWTKEEREFLNATYNTELVAWESAGFFRAAKYFDILALELRIPTDFSTMTNYKEFKKCMKSRFLPLKEQIDTFVKMIQNSI